MSESEPEGIRMRTRTLGRVYPDEGTMVVVEHVFEPEGAGTCEDCGNPSHDPGMVALVVRRHADGDGDEGEFASVLLTAEDALVLANRLARGASLVLESGEETPDLEREAAKFGGHGA